MKDFFKSFFASLLAMIVFCGGAFLLLMLLFAALGASSKPTVPAKAVLVMDLSMSITDSTRDSDPSLALQRALRGGEIPNMPLMTLIQTLDRAAKDPNIAALYLTGNVVSADYGSGPAALKEVREALQRFKANSGKSVLAYNMMWAKKDLLLISGATTVYMNPVGMADVTGPVAEMTFYAGAFKKYGIEVQPFRVGKYKSYVEPYILEKASPENKEQLNQVLGDIWSEWKASIAQDRKKTAEDIQALADEKGILTASEALKVGLVDKLVYEDEVLDQLKTLSGKTAKDRDFPQISIEEYAKIPDTARGKNRIAVVYAEGDIYDGEAPGQVGGDRVARELRKLRLDSSVKAIVLRVNSPGGSGMASDVILREVMLAKKEKPLIVSMGSYAASGGYYISAQADRIFAEPNTLTGSIGVFGMTANIKKLANEHGITWDSVQMAKLGTPTLSRPATPEEMVRLQNLTDNFYEVFLEKVAEGRKMKKEAVHEVAQGRVWSGKQALKIGLVDELGGMQDAIRYAAKMAKVESDYRVDMPAAPRSPMERMLEIMGGGHRRKQADAAFGPLGQAQEEMEKARHALRLLSSSSSGVYMRMPYEISIR